MANQNVPIPPVPDLKFPKCEQPFRYFVQTVLPAVYGDELSYYELLAKVVNVLNELIENSNNLNYDMQELYKSYKQLHIWVNDYFTNLDIQDEINKALDHMVTSGKLSEIFNAFMEEKTKQINESLNNNTTLLEQGLSKGFVDVENKLRKEFINGINGMPIFINNIEEAIDINKLYILKSTMHIFQYQNGVWVDTGVTYPQVILSDGYVTPNMTTFASQDILTPPLSYESGFYANPSTNLFVENSNVKELSIFKFEKAGTYLLLWFPASSPQGAYLGVSNQAPAVGGAAIKAYALPAGSFQWNKQAYGYWITTTENDQYVSVVTKWAENSAKAYIVENRVSTTPLSVNDIVFKGLGPTFTGKNFISRSITPDKLSFAEQYGNLTKTYIATFPGYIAVNNRNEPLPSIYIQDENGNTYFSAVVPAKPNTVYNFDKYYAAELDEFFNVIQCSIYPNITTTENCAYISVAYDKSMSPETTVLWTGDNKPNYDYGGWNFNANEIVPKYTGKNVLTLGDSITAYGPSADNGWQNYFNQVVKASRIDNVAVSGAHWRDLNDNTVYDGNPQPDSSEQNVMGNQVQKIINNRSNYLSDYDVIFLAAGTNERGNILPTYAEIDAQYYDAEGKVKPLSEVKRNTWPGCFRWVYENLRQLFPTAKIYVMTPIQRYGTTMFQLVDTITQIEELLSERISVDSINMLNCGVYGSSYNGTSNSGDFIDGLHPNEKGARKMGYYVAQRFIEYFNNNGR